MCGYDACSIECNLCDTLKSINQINLKKKQHLSIKKKQAFGV